MLDTGILLGRKRTMNISWTRCLGLTLGRAGIASGRRPRAVHGESKGALARVEASELSYGRQPVVRRCSRVRRANQTDLGAERLATMSRSNPERLAKSASLKGAEEFLARINREFLAVKQALRAEKTK
jgi:hypothetical protein